MTTTRNSKQPSTTERARRATQKATAKGQGQPQESEWQPTLAPPSATVNAAATWRQTALGEKLQLPSGAVCMARRVGLDVLIKQGSIPNALLPIVQRWTGAGAKGKQVTDDEIAMDLLANQDAVLQLLEMFNACAMAVVTKPELRPTPMRCRHCHAQAGQPCRSEGHSPELEKVPDEQRVLTDDDGNDIGYIDWVPEGDKAYLFNYAVGGTRDVQRFRDETESVERVLASQNLEVPAE